MKNDIAQQIAFSNPIYYAMTLAAILQTTTTFRNLSENTTRKSLDTMYNSFKYIFMI